MVARCIELKRNVVMEDEFDTGARQKLNLGHTIGHSIEAQSNFEVSHGQAVAIGMNIVSKAAASLGICSYEVFDRILGITKLFSLPFSTEFTAQDIYSVSLSDKKRAGKTVNLIVPKAIGECIIYPIPISELRSFIEAGL